jgi:hypothetical protein
VLLQDDPFYQGQQNLMWVTGAPPGSTVRFLGSFTGSGAGPCLPGGSPCLEILPAIQLLGTDVADASGNAELSVFVPPTPTINVWIEAVVSGVGPVRTTNHRLVTIAQDADGDGVFDDQDNCPTQANAAQFDADADGFGAVCDCDDSDSRLLGPSTWYLDGDGDGHGTLPSQQACFQPPGYAGGRADDCEDTDPGIYPGALDVCDGLDNDCDGVDEGCP